MRAAAQKQLFVFHGEGHGDKLGKLHKYSEQIIDCGIGMRRRNSIGWSHVLPILEKCDAIAPMKDGNVGRAVRNALKADLGLLDPVCKSIFAGYLDDGVEFLAGRASGAGDASGNGGYKSRFCKNGLEEMKMAIRFVMAGFCTRKAIDFRNDTKTREEMGIIIEPVVGQWWNTHDGRVFAPVVSGTAKSKTPEGFLLGFVVGLASRFMHDPSLGIFVRETKETAQFLSFEDVGRTSKAHGYWFPSSSVALNELGREVVKHDLDIYDISGPGVDNKAVDEKVGGIISKVEMLSSKIGSPIYVEFASEMRGRLEYELLQIDDDYLNKFTFGKKELGGKTIIHEGDCLTGWGVKEIQNVIFMEMQDELDRYKKDIVMGEFEKAISGLEKTMVVWRGLGNRKAGWTGRLWKKATVLAICNHSHEHVFETMQLHEGRMIGMGGRLALGFREMPKIPDDQVDCRKKFAGGEVVQLKKPIYAIGSEREGNAALYSE